MMLADRVAVVTGAASGIGRATAERFAAEGARLALGDVDLERGRALARSLKKRGADVWFAELDVSNADQVSTFFSQLSKRFGRLDLAVNSAGTGGPGGTLQEQALESFQRLMAINLKGVWLTMRAELKLLLESGGALVNVASVLGLEPDPRAPFYSAAKAAVLGLTRSAALEYAPLGVRINAVCPGPIRTPLLERAYHDKVLEQLVREVPTRRLAEPEEIAEVITFLCSDGASFIAGHPLVADGGVTLR